MADPLAAVLLVMKRHLLSKRGWRGRCQSLLLFTRSKKGRDRRVCFWKPWNTAAIVDQQGSKVVRICTLSCVRYYHVALECGICAFQTFDLLSFTYVVCPLPPGVVATMTGLLRERSRGQSQECPLHCKGQKRLYLKRGMRAESCGSGVRLRCKWQWDQGSPVQHTVLIYMKELLKNKRWGVTRLNEEKGLGLGHLCCRFVTYLCLFYVYFLIYEVCFKCLAVPTSSFPHVMYSCQQLY